VDSSFFPSLLLSAYSLPTTLALFNNEQHSVRINFSWIHPGSGRVYNYSYKPPKEHGKDDVTGEALVQRDDDQPHKVRTRLQAYETVTAPLVGYYADKGVLETFSGTESDVIYPMVKVWLQDKIV